MPVEVAFLTGGWRFSILSSFLLSCMLGASAWSGLSAVHGQESLDASQVVPAPRAHYLGPLANFLPESDANHAAFGNPQLGQTLGLEGLVYLDGNPDCGYARWRLIVRRADGRRFPRDERLRVEFFANYSHYGLEPQVEHFVELKQGQFESVTSFLSPHYPQDRQQYSGSNLSLHVRFFREGRLLPGLSAQSFDWNGYSPNPNQAPSRSVLLGTSTFLKKQNYDSSTLTAAEVSKALDRLQFSDGWIASKPQLAVLDRLPKDWRELACFSTLAIHPTEFGVLDADQRQALLRFVVTGGELVVAECHGPDEFPEEMATWLRQSLPADADRILDTAEWKKKPVPLPVRWCPVGYGQLVAMPERLAKGLNADVWPINDHEMRYPRLLSVDKMDWTLPQLGQPPVAVFCFSIATFALVAGPGVLWWTSRRLRRPIWLLILFPLTALLITAGIFTYAIIHDGFGIHGRLRSLTWIDASSGFGCAYSRQTYFSGFPPTTADFDATSEVWEIHTSHEMRNVGYAPSHSDIQMRSLGGDQQYRNWLPARQQKQWVVTTPVTDLIPFQVDLVADGRMRITNRLEEAISFGVFVDAASRPYVIRDLAGGAVVEVANESPENVNQSLDRLFPRSVYPSGYDPNANLSLLNWFNRSSYGQYGLYSGFKNQSPRSNFEEEAESWGKDITKHPRRFLLSVEKASHLDRPFGEAVEESGSNHLIFGVW